MARPPSTARTCVNPGSVILLAEMMLRHMGWVAAAHLIRASMERAIASKTVTYDFACLMKGVTQVSCSGGGGYRSCGAASTGQIYRSVRARPGACSRLLDALS